MMITWMMMIMRIIMMILIIPISIMMMVVRFIMVILIIPMSITYRVIFFNLDPPKQVWDKVKVSELGPPKKGSSKSHPVCN